jgi:hypothetical protein
LLYAVPQIINTELEIRDDWVSHNEKKDNQIMVEKPMIRQIPEEPESSRLPYVDTSSEPESSRLPHVDTSSEPRSSQNVEHIPSFASSFMESRPLYVNQSEIKASIAEVARGHFTRG